MKNDTIVTLSSVDLSAITGGSRLITDNVLTALGVDAADVNASAQAQGWRMVDGYAHGADRAAGKIKENLIGLNNFHGGAVVDRFTTGWKF